MRETVGTETVNQVRRKNPMLRLVVLNKNTSESPAESSPPKPVAQSIQATARPWMQDREKKNKSKNKALPIVVHEIFAKCAKITTDPFWIEKFNKAAFNKFNRGFSFRDGYLVYKKANREMKLHLSTTPEEAVIACISFYAKAGVISPSDQTSQQDILYETLLEKRKKLTSSWATVSKRKKIRASLLANYINTLANKHNLTNREIGQLSEILHSGFILGYFPSKNITLEDERIIQIKGLIFDEEKRKFSVESNIVRHTSSRYDSSTTEKHNNKDVNFFNLWIKYLDTLEKKLIQEEMDESVH